MPCTRQSNPLPPFAIVVLSLLLPCCQAALAALTAEASDIIVYPVEVAGLEKTVYDSTLRIITNPQTWPCKRAPGTIHNGC